MGVKRKGIGYKIDYTPSRFPKRGSFRVSYPRKYLSFYIGHPSPEAQSRVSVTTFDRVYLQNPGRNPPELLALLLL